MAETRTARLALPQWSAGGDGPSRADFNEAFANLEARAAIYAQGVRSARPSAGTPGRIYTVVGDGTPTLNGAQFYDTGTAWIPLSGNSESATVRGIDGTLSGSALEVVAGSATATSPATRWYTAARALVASMAADGTLTGYRALFGKGLVDAADLNAMTTAEPAKVPLGISGAANQAAALTNWRSSAGAVLASVSAAGRGTFTGLTANGTLAATGDTSLAKAALTGSLTGVDALFVSPTTTSSVLRARAIANQAGALQRWEAPDGSYLAMIDASGRLIELVGASFGGGAPGGSGSRVGVKAATGVQGIVIDAAADAADNLLSWRNDAGTSLGRITGSGALYAYSSLEAQAPSGQVAQITRRNGDGDLTQWRDGATTIAKVDVAGVGRFARVQSYAGDPITDDELVTKGYVDDSVFPIGGVIAWPGESGTIPSRFLYLDGRTNLAVASYPKLAARYGQKYGGNGSTLFGIPDARARLIMGVGTGFNLGDTEGLAEGSRSTRWSHAHAHGASSGSAGAHSHNIRPATTARLGRADGAGSTTSYEHDHPCDSAGAHSHSVTVNSGGTSEHANIAFHWIVRAL